MRMPLGRRALGALLAVGLGAVSARADIQVTAEAPHAQQSSVSSVTTENFDSFDYGQYTTLATAVGTVTSPGAAIVAPDAYGGSYGTRYFSIGAQSGQTSATLALGQDRAYFGFFWGAGDARNELQFFHNGNLIFDFHTSDVINFLDGLPNKSAYYGNPNNGQDAGEPFVYLNFFGTNGTVFDTVKFLNDGVSSGFETDNWSVRTDPAPPTGTPITTPEPSAALISIAGSLGMALAARRLRGRD